MKLRFLKLLIIPFLITIIYLLLLSYPYFFSKINQYDSLGPLSVIEEQSAPIQKTFSPQRKTDTFDNHLLKGETASFKLKASENNLGVVLIKFTRFGKVSDRVVFRLKEEGGKTWYYENVYKADQFQPDQYFTFGFPSIQNSKNTAYVVEIESLAGTYKNGIGISSDEPRVAFVYRYHRNDLKNFGVLLSFIVKKSVYAATNINFLQNWKLLSTFVFFLLLVFFMNKKNITSLENIVFFLVLKKSFKNYLKEIIKKITARYLPLEKKIIRVSKKTNYWFISTSLYKLFLNTNIKKRLAIGLSIFIIAFTYRFAASLVDQSSLFYAGLGGQGDYDQLIRAAMCAPDFCSRILEYNSLFKAPILGTFYKMFGFIGGIKVFLYIMLIISSIVTTIPYFLLSRKSWFTVGGIVGGIFLATSDFLTLIALGFPSDNSSLFTFSMFFIVYLLTIHIGTIRWVLFFGLMGLVDGLNKVLFLINDLVAFVLFIPVFFYERARKSGKSIFQKKNIKLLLLSTLPLLIFLIGYSAWEYIVYIKFSATYFLRGIIPNGGPSAYISFTSFDDTSLSGNIVLSTIYMCVQAIIMIKNLIEYSNLQIIFLAPIFIGLFFFTSRKLLFEKYTRKFQILITLSISLLLILTIIKSNFYRIHEIFKGEYIRVWTEQVYIGIFLFVEIIILFILNFKYSASKFFLPILPYFFMLIIMAKNAPFARLHTHVVAWSIIFLAYIIDFLIVNISKKSNTRIRIISGSALLMLFIFVYIFPKMTTMTIHLYSGLATSKSEGIYLKWVDSELPKNAVVLAGGQSNLVTVAENIKKPIIYSALWSGALLIRPNEIPGIKPSSFGIVSELQNKNNFKVNKYIILDDDIYIWRERVTGMADSVFSASRSAAALYTEDYSVRIYKYNPTLKRTIFELNFK